MMDCWYFGRKADRESKCWKNAPIRTELDRARETQICVKDRT